jgi:hypothetical protein
MGKFGIAAAPQPSAIFIGIEAQARRIWLVSPYNSSLGNRSVD